MPIAVKRNIIEADEMMNSNITNEEISENGIKARDVAGRTYMLPVYYVFVFRKEIPIILFYLSKGLSETLEFLNVDHVISFISTMPEERDPDTIYFQLSSKCFLTVNRYLFNKYPYIQSVVGGFLTVCTNRVTLEQLDDPKVWIKKIANPNNYEKGLDVLKYFNRLLDETTKKILKINPYHTENIYTLLRWIMQEFNTLRLKDNLDLKNKRLRCNEYVASLLTKEFSKRLRKIFSLGDKATIDNYRDVFKFPGDILIQKMH